MILEEDFGSSRLFVINDPRVCRILDFWVQALQDVGASALMVSPIRDPGDVVTALGWRGTMDASLGHLVWLRYVLDAEVASRRIPRAYVRYCDIRSDVRTLVDRLGRRLGISWPAVPHSIQLGSEGAAIHAEGQNDGGGDEPPSIPNQPRWIASTFEVLDRWACSDLRNTDEATLDSLRSAFDDAASTFGPAVTLGQDASRQSRLLERRVAVNASELDRCQKESATLHGRVESLEAEVAALHASRSWRATAPLRSVSGIRGPVRRWWGGTLEDEGEPRKRTASRSAAADEHGAPTTGETDLSASVPTAPARPSSVGEGSSDLVTIRRRSRTTERALVWLYRSAVQKSGLMMRGKQLSDMVRQSIGEGVSVQYLSEQGISSITGAVVIVTRSFLADATPAELEAIRARDNVICVDYIDWPVRDDLDELVDVYIASSIKQFKYYQERYPHKLVHHVTHHADPAIAGVATPSDYCNIGYFGEIGNARHRHALQGYIDFVQTNNSEYLRRDWLHRLRHCNVHYSCTRLHFPPSRPEARRL